VSHTGRRALVASVAAGLLLLTTGCSLVRGGGGGANRAERPPPSFPAVVSPGHSPDVFTTRGPRPPEEGAWLGAWVKPQRATPSGRAEAFAAFERQVDAELRIVHMYHDWASDVLGPADFALAAEADLLMLSWAGTDTRSMAMGTYDPLIRQTAEKVKAYGRPLLLRFRWEMDRPNLQASVHSSADFIAAWRHTRAIFTDVGADNAGWVWCPHVQGFNESDRDAREYYPGDDQVDWLCADVYAGTDFAGYAAQMNAFMAFASQHPRPIMVGEFAVTRPGEPGQRAAWLREVRTYTKNHPQIRALVYFAAKQDRAPVYDSTFAEDPDGLTAFKELAADPYFQQPLAVGDR